MSTGKVTKAVRSAAHGTRTDLTKINQNVVSENTAVDVNWKNNLWMLDLICKIS